MDYLNNGRLLFEQPDHLYKCSGDALALAQFVTCNKKDTVYDIGCGTGVLSLIIADCCHPKALVAVDINPAAVAQMQKNVALNQAQLAATQFTITAADARTLTQYHYPVADVLVCNPPYFHTGKKPVNANQHLARHDDTLSLAELAKVCTQNVRYGGMVYFCYPADHLAHAITTFENANFRVKKIKLIANQKGVYLALFACKKGGGHHTTILV